MRCSFVPHMVRARCLSGLLAVHTRCASGSLAMLARCTSGSPAVHVCLARGAHLVHVWLARVVRLARTWSPHLAPRVWTTKPPGFPCSLPRLSWMQGLPMRAFSPNLSQVAKGLIADLHNLQIHFSISYYYFIQCWHVSNIPSWIPYYFFLFTNYHIINILQSGTFKTFH